VARSGPEWIEGRGVQTTVAFHQETMTEDELIQGQGRPDFLTRRLEAVIAAFRSA
jgi:hypothetical protein